MDMAEVVMEHRTVVGAGLEERLEQAAVVARRLSHDFGNVLTGVLGFTELAMTHGPTGTRCHGYIQEVWDAARGGADWLKKLHLFCRRSTVPFTPSGLAGALAEEEARLEVAAGTAWQADIPADLHAIACDNESLRQALRQVLDNAREATGGRERVSVQAREIEVDSAVTRRFLGQPEAGRYIEVTITDHGPGLSEEACSRLFRDWFYSSKPRHRGMGLMVVYGILKRTGGGMMIASSPEGGTQVQLLFPAAPDALPAGPARLMIVDEDPQVLAEARRILEPAGYSVQVATSAPEAMALHHAAPAGFDLILIASLLTNLNGPELAHRLLLRAPDASFLFLHTPSPLTLQPDRLLTADTLVYKPLASPVLLQAVAAALRRRRNAAD
jgi:CheY-like chemotaxis protein